MKKIVCAAAVMAFAGLTSFATDISKLEDAQPALSLLNSMTEGQAPDYAPAVPPAFEPAAQSRHGGAQSYCYRELIPNNDGSTTVTEPRLRDISGLTGAKGCTVPISMYSDNNSVICRSLGFGPTQASSGVETREVIAELDSEGGIKGLVRRDHADAWYFVRYTRLVCGKGPASPPPPSAKQRTRGMCPTPRIGTVSHRPTGVSGHPGLAQLKLVPAKRAQQHSFPQCSTGIGISYKQVNFSSLEFVLIAATLRLLYLPVL
ncbi:MAG: hypothetical protein ABIG11_02735 [bacterium]